MHSVSQVVMSLIETPLQSFLSPLNTVKNLVGNTAFQFNAALPYPVQHILPPLVTHTNKYFCVCNGNSVFIILPHLVSIV